MLLMHMLSRIQTMQEPVHPILIARIESKELRIYSNRSRRMKIVTSTCQCASSLAHLVNSTTINPQLSRIFIVKTIEEKPSQVLYTLQVSPGSSRNKPSRYVFVRIKLLLRVLIVSQYRALLLEQETS